MEEEAEEEAEEEEEEFSIGLELGPRTCGGAWL